jgi:uncharacterized Zn finger protein
MWSLIQFLIFGHIHKWEIHEVITLTRKGDAVGKRYVLRCEKCGSVTSIDC